jgi:YVTN family beta-propeller protein
MGRKNIQNLIAVLSCCILLAACVKDKPNTPVASIPAVTNDNIYIVCEGSFGNGDASLYQFDNTTGQVSGDLYKAANSAALGDVFQSMVRIGERLFLSVNNSDKIVVLNDSDKKQVGSISIPKPRYILPLSNTKAYVSTLYSNKVYIINPQTMQVTGDVTMPYQNAEGMVLYNGKAYICNWDTACHNVYAIDTSTNQIVSTILIKGGAPQEAVVDKNNNLWVLSGNVTKGVVSYLTVLNTSGNIAKSYVFPSKADVVKPVIDNNKEILYFIEVNYYGSTDNNGIYRMNISDASLPNTAFVSAKQYQYFWALGIHPVSNLVFAGDPKGFTQKSSISVYNTDGSLNKQFNAGIGVGHFYFDNQ